MKTCTKCKETKSVDNFTIRKDRKNTRSSHCKNCVVARVSERRRINKRKCIEYKGGKCTQCGYDKCDRALEFHHLDPTEKDFIISKNIALKFDKMKPELDKCILVCANCHREIHDKAS
jgi:hypothetical protein